MPIQAIPIENKEEIETLLKKHKFIGTSFRLNVASNDETVETSGGRKILKKRLNQTLRNRGRCLMPLSNTTLGLNNSL